MSKPFAIQQGDQYAIPFRISADCQSLTPDDCDDVRIQIGSLLKSYADGTLTYDAEAGVWAFPVTEAETAAWSAVVQFQVGVRVGGDFIYSTTGTLPVLASLIKEAWSG